jgi:hypothetical protein
MTKQLKNQKDQLAKLMASENLTIVHKKVPTAYFDMKNRILCCPIFKEDLSKELYDLFMGHEVGHALNTPWEGVHSALTKNRTLKGYLNVVEDVRIEKAIKNKYPGLRKSFFTAYNELMEMDFFGIKKRDIQELSLIDKINLITKVGHRVNIKLNPTEGSFLQMAEACTTWEEVEICATAIYEWSKENETRDEQDEALVPQTMMDEEMDWDGDEDMDDDGYGEDSEDDSEEGSSNGDGEEDSDEDGDTLPDVEAFGNNPTEDDNDAENSSDNDGEESKEESAENNVKPTGREGGKGSDLTNENFDKEDGARESLTEHNAHNNEEMFMSDENMTSTTVLLKDEFKKRDNFKNTVVSYKKMINDWTPFWEVSDEIYGDSDDKVAKRLLKAKFSSKRLKDKNKKIVSHMAKEFEMKQTAQRSVKAFQGKTGKLDMNKLAKYQIVDDIFRKVTYLPDGKNHGLQIMLDWSGSISGEAADLLEQTLILVDFCRMVNIPHRVYLFSDVYYTEIERNLRQSEDYFENEPKLIELFSDKMSTREFNENHKNVAHLYNGYMFDSGKYRNFQKTVDHYNAWFGDVDYIDYDSCGWYNMDRHDAPRNYRLGGTPLDHTITAMRVLVPLFNAEYGIEKSILTVITDGYSHSSEVFKETEEERKDKHDQQDTCSDTSNYSWRTRNKRFLVDPFTNKSHLLSDTNASVDSFNRTQNLLDWVSKETGCIVTGYFVLSGKNDFWGLHGALGQTGHMNAEIMWKQCRKEGLSLKVHGYNKLFLTTSSALSVQGDAELSDDLVGANKRKLLGAFKKNQSSKVTSRFLTNEFIKEIA